MVDIKITLLPSVYEPAEDSFMLAEAAKTLKGKILEIGCGSGFCSLTCAPGNDVLGVDINPEAVKCAKENAKLNNLKAKFIVSDLFSNVPKEKFDGILFNPPYLPTKKDEKLDGELNKAFDGGISGRKVLDKFLDEFDFYLKSGGILLLVQSSLNNEEKTFAKLAKMKYKIEKLTEEKYFFERLFVIKAVKP